jgi:hypothetical protein
MSALVAATSPAFVSCGRKGGIHSWLSPDEVETAGLPAAGAVIVQREIPLPTVATAMSAAADASVLLNPAPAQATALARGARWSEVVKGPQLLTTAPQLQVPLAVCRWSTPTSTSAAPGEVARRCAWRRAGEHACQQGMERDGTQWTAPWV